MFYVVEEERGGKRREEEEEGRRKEGEEGGGGEEEGEDGRRGGRRGYIYIYIYTCVHGRRREEEEEGMYFVLSADFLEPSPCAASNPASLLFLGVAVIRGEGSVVPVDCRRGLDAAADDSAIIPSIDLPNLAVGCIHSGGPTGSNNRNWEVSGVSMFTSSYTRMQW